MTGRWGDGGTHGGRHFILGLGAEHEGDEVLVPPRGVVPRLVRQTLAPHRVHRRRGGPPAEGRRAEGTHISDPLPPGSGDE